jgi:hypothetical protein
LELDPGEHQYGAASYIVILLGEYAAWLPVGPDEPAWEAGGGRPLIGTLVWASMVGAITFATTALIGADQLISRADANVYAAKEAGGDRVVGPPAETGADTEPA